MNSVDSGNVTGDERIIPATPGEVEIACRDKNILIEQRENIVQTVVVRMKKP